MAISLALLPTLTGAAGSDWNCAQSKGQKNWTCDDPAPGPSANGTHNTSTGQVEPAPGLEIAKNTSPNVSTAAVAGSAPAKTNSSLRPSPEFPPEAEEEPIPLPPRREPQTSQAALKATPGEWECRGQNTPKSDDDSSNEYDVQEPGWNCAKQASAPGQPETGKVPWYQSNTVTSEDELRFQHLMGLLPVDPWKNVCSPNIRQKMRPLSDFKVTLNDRQARKKAPVIMDANQFENINSEVMILTGNARIEQADQIMEGEYINRNSVSNVMNSHGNVYYRDKSIALASDSGFMQMDSGRGVFRNSQVIFPGSPARGISRLTNIESDTLSHYENFTYTSCPAGDTDWLLHADHVTVDEEAHVGTAKNAWMEFKGVPIFWTPYMAFPINKQRTSGFLAPSLGTSSTNGFNFQLPYYFNLAPNYDYTVTPRYMVDRGFQLKNEFRYMTEMTRGVIYGDIVPHDNQIASGSTDKIQVENIPVTRGQVGVLNNTRFSERLTGNINGNYVSDYLYLNQLGSQLSINDRTNIFSYANLAYQGDSYSLRTQVDYFQTVDPNIIANNGQPFFHLPQIFFNYSRNIADTGLLLETPIQADSFMTMATNKTTGQRLKIMPKLYYPLLKAGGFITPSITLQHNQYWLQNPTEWGTANNVDTSSSEGFTVPIFSVDAGTYFDRDLELGETPMLQTLEPRIFYDYIPYVNQTQFPVFDSSTYDYTFYQLFRENRFTGSDRVGDTNQINLALTSRLIDQTTGLERLRGSIGSAIYFTNRQVTLDNAGYGIYGVNYIPTTLASQTEDTSNLIGEVGVGITREWSFRTGGQYNPWTNQIQRGVVSLQYNDNNNVLLNASYRYRVDQTTLDCVNVVNNGCLNLTDVSLRMPIYNGWFFIGRWQYSILNNFTLESFAGLERETCCWRFAFLVRDYVNNYITTTSTPQSNFGFFFQVELKGFSNLGDEFDQFLERSITGYRYRQNY